MVALAELPHVGPDSEIPFRARLCLLGLVELHVADRVIRDTDLNEDALAVICLLALQPSTALHREQVIDALWPTMTIDHGSNKLYKAIHLLRRALPDDPVMHDLVTVERQIVRLADWVAVDLRELRSATHEARATRTTRAWEAAARLHTGPLLVNDRHDWTKEARDEVTALNREAHRELADAYLDDGDLRNACLLLDDLIDEDDCDEHAHRSLMRAFEALGTPERALAQYDRCVTALRGRGRSPTHATETLHRAISGRVADAIGRDRAPCPPVRFILTPDGTRLAHQVLGDGFPLVHVSLPVFSHLQREWDLPIRREWYLRLANGRSLVRYDGRGLGMSTRLVNDLSVEAAAADLLAVVDSLGCERFDLFAGLLSSLAAVRLATDHPERVRSLVLWAPIARGSEFTSLPASRAMLSLAGLDWEWYGHAMARSLLAFDPQAPVNHLAEVVLESSNADYVEALFGTYLAGDVTALLSRLSAPTLVLYRPSAPFPPASDVEHLISLIPDVDLIPISGTAPLPIDARGSVVSAIHEFLDSGRR